MHKHFSLWVVVLAAIIAAGLVGSAIADASSWISSPLDIVKQADTKALPTSINGNIDCQQDSALNCSFPTLYGAASQKGAVRLNSSGDFWPVYSYQENKPRFIAIPNSNTFITYTTEPAYGFYFYFNYNFTSSITKSNVPFSTLPAYKVNRPPDARLTNKSGQPLAVDFASASFSANGRWMVISAPNATMLRVDLETFEVIPFAPGFNYSIGLDPAVKTAVSNDGRYAVVVSNTFNAYRIYDLSTCGPTPLTPNRAANCQSRDLSNFLARQISGFYYLSQVRFLSDNSISIYASYKEGALNKTARYVLSEGSPISQTDLLALGDSFISGQGAFNYQGGTDSESNDCHLSSISYPYLIGRELNYSSYHSVACSGAKTDDITNSNNDYAGQADGKEIKRSDRSQDYIDSVLTSFKPGYVNQLDFVRAYQPKNILVSIGGNDMGFSDIVKACAFWPTTCYSTYEDRVELINEINSEVFPKLVDTYQQIKNSATPDAKVYVVGYPQVAKPGGNCADNVRLDNDEITFSQQLIAYLDSAIRQAATTAGVYYVDTQDAFAGHLLCEAGPGSVAVNGLTAGNDQPGWLGGPIGNESYHPNWTGHLLLENKILSITKNLTAPMPTADLNAPTPTKDGLQFLNAPRSGRAINEIEYDSDISSDVIYKGARSTFVINGSEHGLRPATQLQAELHSNPTALGTYTTDSLGNLSASIVIPASVTDGYHTIHFYGSDLTGQPIDIYKIIYVASNAPASDNKTGDQPAEQNPSTSLSNNVITLQNASSAVQATAIGDASTSAQLLVITEAGLGPLPLAFATESAVEAPPHFVLAAKAYGNAKQIPSSLAPKIKIGALVIILSCLFGQFYRWVIFSRRERRQ